MQRRRGSGRFPWHGLQVSRYFCYQTDATQRPYAKRADCSSEGSYSFSRLCRSLDQILRGHSTKDGLNVLDCVFHPRQPWLATAGADGTARLYV